MRSTKQKIDSAIHKGAMAAQETAQAIQNSTEAMQQLGTTVKKRKIQDMKAYQQEYHKRYAAIPSRKAYRKLYYQTHAEEICRKGREYREKASAKKEN